MTTKTAIDGMMTIGDAANAVGVATSVLCYYEDQGLLVPSARSDSGYRMYASKEVDRLRFIRSAQDVGFNLKVGIAKWESPAARQVSAEFELPGLPFTRIFDEQGKLLGQVQDNFIERIQAIIRSHASPRREAQQ